MQPTFDIPTRSLFRVDNATGHVRNALDAVGAWAGTRDAKWCACARATNVDNEAVLRLYRRQESVLLDLVLELAAGDAAHNLRVALDAFAIEMGYQHGIPPAEVEIQFPCEKPDRDIAGRDARLKRKIRKVFGDNPPATLADRITQLQSWSNPPLWFPNMLEVIVALDNADKHHFGLVALLGPVYSQELDRDRMTPLPARHYDLIQDDLTWADFPNLPELPTMPMWFPLDGVEPILATAYGWGALEEVFTGLADDVRRSLRFLVSGDWLDPCKIPGRQIGDDLLPDKEPLVDPRRTQAMNKRATQPPIRTRLSDDTFQRWTQPRP